MRPDFETFKAIITSTITISIITGIMYLAGIFYEGGFFETLKVETSLFPKSFEDQILTGGLTLFSNYILIIIYIAISLAAPYLFSCMAWEIKDSKLIAYLFGKPSAQVTPLLDHHGRIQRLKSKTLPTLFISLFFTVFVLIAGLMMVESYKSGVRYAQKLITDQIKNPEDSNSKITLENGKVVLGHIIRCSEHRCAILDKKTVSILPMNQISMIQLPETKLEERRMQQKSTESKGE